VTIDLAALALHEGTPVRDELLPYSQQTIEAQDIAAVVDALQSRWLTTGPAVAAFEAAFARAVDTPHAVAVSNGTAALHAAMFAAGIGPGDEVIVPAITFAATANAVVYQGGTPVFADVDADTLLIDAGDAERLITSRTKAVVAVDYAGQPCDYGALRTLASAHGLVLIADACHSLGGRWQQQRVGSLADMTAFSLHPVKQMTTGEGGVLTTGNADVARRAAMFRNHGITSDHHDRRARGIWQYEMTELGYNYRLTDIQCALGLSQLSRLDAWVARRNAIAARYDDAFATNAAIRPLARLPERVHAYHLYVIRLAFSRLSASRGTVFAALRAEGIGVNVHYVPVYLHPYYRRHFATEPGLCPRAEAAYEEILSLPLFPAMADRDVDDVITAVEKVTAAYERR
jgi:perosamine synthetase